jgi:hypothetical protein
MKKRFLSTVALLVLASLGLRARAESPPSVELKNDKMTLTVLLPDDKHGYYRGSRFDWHGIVSKVEFAGHTLFNEWKSPHDPNGHDDVGGTAEEFGMFTPIGYDAAGPGEPFLKIGIGILQRTNKEKYEFWKPFKVVSTGREVTTSGPRTAMFQQGIEFQDYAYFYSKIVELDADHPAFTIHRELKNTGKKPIHTDHYCHHFLSFDNKPVGRDYKLTFPVAPNPRPKADFNTVARFNGADLSFTGPLDKGTIYMELDGFGDKSAGFAVKAQDTKTGFGVKITGNVPVREWHVWGIKTTLCPEPFVDIKLAPGETKKWATRYELFVDLPKKSSD